MLELVPGKPILLAWLQGSNGNLSTILLNSHMDVVPVELQGWTKDPFAATVEQDRIYGRGTQDMKVCCCAPFVEFIRKTPYSLLPFNILKH